MFLVVAASALILLATVVYLIDQSASRQHVRARLESVNGIGERRFPIVGDAYSLLLSSCRPWERVSEWMDRHSGSLRSIKFEFMTKQFVVVGNVKAIRHILTNTDTYRKDSKTFAPFRDLLGEGLVTAEGERWRRERRIMAPAFRGGKALRHVAVAAYDAAVRMISRLDVDVQSSSSKTTGCQVEWAGEFRSLTLQVIAQAVMSLSPDESDAVLPRLYLPIVEEANLRTFFPWRYLMPNSAYDNAVRDLNKFVVDFIRQRWRERVERQQRAGGGALHLDILDRLLISMGEEHLEHGDATSSPSSSDSNGAGDTSSECPEWIARQLRDEIKTFLLAGHETSSMMLTWALYEVVRNEEVARKLKEEAHRVFPDGVLGVDAPPDYAQLNSLSYAECVLKEALRLYSVVPVVTRETVTDETVEGIALPPNCSIVIPIRYIHHRADLWPEPLEFRPGRWLERVDAWHFLGFIAGPRFCIGQHFALLEAKIVLAMIMRHFDVVANDKTSNDSHRFTIPTCPTEGMFTNIQRSID
jgi:cytochrome P450